MGVNEVQFLCVRLKRLFHGLFRGANKPYGMGGRNQSYINPANVLQAFLIIFTLFSNTLSDIFPLVNHTNQYALRLSEASAFMKR